MEDLVRQCVGRGDVGAVQGAWRRGGETGHVVAGACDARSRFPLASLSKPLVATACLLAADEGQLDLDADLAALVPEARCRATLRELLCHAGGLPFDSADARRVQLDPSAGWREVAAAYCAVEPADAPRTRRLYSNAGYALAALALERAMGAEYRTAIQHLVLDPLEVTGTDFGAGADDPAVIAVREPGLLGHGEQLFNGSRFRGLGLPQSGAFGTADDYLRLLDAIAGVGPTSLPPAVRAGLLTGQCGEPPGGVEGFMTWPRCAWTAGFDLRDGKSPHWTGTALSPAAISHFGASGALAVHDPSADASLVLLADRSTYSGWMLEPGGWPDICAALVA